MHRFPKLSKLWGSNAIKPINPDMLEKRLKKVLNSSQCPSNPVSKALWHKFPVRIGTDTDPFPPIEGKYRVTKRILEILNEHSYPYIINTKSVMVAEDEYLNLLKDSPAGAIVQFTIISLDEELISKIEPGAPPVGKRLEAMETLSDQDIYVQTRISPIIPELTDGLEEMQKLFQVLKERGTRDLIVEYLRYNPFIRRWMSSALGVAPTYIDEIFLKTYRECSGAFPDCCNRNQDRFGCGWNGRPKMINGYIRVPMRLKLQRYKSFKKEVEKAGLRFYVCSEEFPEINECVNCCGITGKEARRYLKFDHDNEACANTLPYFIKTLGEISADDVLKRMFSIHESIFREKFAKLDKYLVNVRKTSSGGWGYDKNFQI